MLRLQLACAVQARNLKKVHKNVNLKDTRYQWIDGKINLRMAIDYSDTCNFGFFYFYHSAPKNRYTRYIYNYGAHQRTKRGNPRMYPIKIKEEGPSCNAGCTLPYSIQTRTGGSSYIV